MAGFRDEKLPPFHRLATGFPSRELRPAAGDCERRLAVADGRLLVTNATEIRYSNPADGRGASIFFNLLDLTPALDAEGSTNHQGDDISIEAIAESNPGFFLVLDRDAAVTSDGETTPALELINGSTALAGVSAVQNQAIYVMPADYYLTEDIYAYIDVLGGLQQAFTEHK